MKELQKTILNDDFQEIMVQDIQNMLDEELKKSVTKRDYHKIDELTRAYAEIMGAEEKTEEAMQRCISSIKGKLRPHKKIRKEIRIMLTAACIGIMLFVLNTLTVSAWDKDLFSMAVYLSENNFLVELLHKPVDPADIITLPTSEDDPYGMIAECAKHDIYPETPHYLPENFVLTYIGYTDMPSFSREMTFIFTNSENKDKIIMFSYEIFEDEEYISRTHFVNYEHHFNEVKVNNKSAILADERKSKKFTVVYNEDTFLSDFSTWGISREELNLIIDSIC